MAEPTRRILSRDTSPDAEAVQIEIYRRMWSPRKLELEVYSPLLPACSDLGVSFIQAELKETSYLS